MYFFYKRKQTFKKKVQKSQKKVKKLLTLGKGRDINRFVAAMRHG